MRINHNLMAMNTNRQLGISNKAGAKSMEKLSSGFKINRAADDAAGLSISEKMRNQIRGLDRASANSQDGISLIQTAEGALDESHAILKRMRELTVQAGNEGTLQQDDLEAIRDEFGELASELDGIADRTEFNGKKLLDGKYTGTLQIGANQTQQLDLDVAVKNIKGESKGKSVLSTTDNIVKAQAEETIKTFENVAFSIKGVEGVTIADGDTGTVAAGKVAQNKVIVSKDADNKLTITLKTKSDGTDVTADTTTNAEVIQALKDAGYEVGAGTGAATGNAAAGTVAHVAAKDQKVKVGGSLNASDLGVSLAKTALKEETDGTNNLEDVLKEGIFFGFEGMSQTDVKTATDTNLERLDAANKAVSKVRSHLGANQNRLEHTIKNLDNAAENIQASEARIRDVDMAKEMIENTKQNILQQASTAMLAQANQAPQSVLRLLG